MLETAAYRWDSQFIIATHSPFILALHGARIYDLDDQYSSIKNSMNWKMCKYISIFLRKKRIFFK